MSGHAYACFYPANAATMISMRNPWGVNPTTSGGYDSSTDGVLDIPSTDAWAKTIDLRIIDPGAAGTAGRITPYVPTQTQTRRDGADPYSSRSGIPPLSNHDFVTGSVRTQSPSGDQTRQRVTSQ